MSAMSLSRAYRSEFATMSTDETPEMPSRSVSMKIVMLQPSCMLSADVCSAFDPGYASCFETKNAAYLGRGLVITKFTGSGGKLGSNDANAEYIAHLRGLFEEAGVLTQTAEISRVDVGGGGTIAYILALYGMNVIDSGVPVLSMHSPWEATSKADIYEALRGYKTFLEKAGLRG